MKNKLTYIGLIATMLSVLGVILKLQHWAGANIALVLGIGILSLIFLPYFGYTLFYELSDNKSKSTAVSAAILFSLIGFSTLFKIMHWPGSSIFFVTEVVFTSLIFLPSLMLIKINTAKDFTEKSMQFFWYLSLLLLILGYGFKVQHWPGASMIFVLGALTLTFVYIPLAYKVYNTAGMSNKLHRQLVIIVTGLVLLLLTTSQTSKIIMNSFVNIDDAINESTKSPNEKVDMYYELIDMINSNNSKTETIVSYYPKQMKVKELSDDLFTYINKLKTVLLKKTDAKLANSANDSISLKDVEFKDISDTPSKILIGNPETPRTGAWSANELKAKIFVFKKAMLDMYEDRTKDLKESAERTIGMNIEDSFSAEDGRNYSWEVKTFYNQPIAADIAILSKIQLDVRTNELSTIQYLINMSRNVGMPANAENKPTSLK